MKKRMLTAIATCLLYAAATAQANLDSVVCRRLAEAGQMDKAINTTNKVKEGKFIKSTNYFIFEKPVMRLSESIALHPVIFGCYRSHTGKNLLIRLDVRSTSTYFFYGGNKLITELQKLRHEILEAVKPSLSDEDRATLISYLSLCYL